MIGRALGHYEVVELLGSGGMGEVYRARDPRLKRDVAIKVLPEGFAADPERLARLEREAHLLAALNHPNVATIHGLEEARSEVEDGVSGAAAPVRFLVLELVEGETLADRLRSGPLELEAALQIARQIAEGLEAAHAKGILHRDLKPANVAITGDGLVKLLDFGLAKPSGPGDGDKGAAGAAEDLSHSPTATIAPSEPGLLLGTAPYMSPEQVRGQALDERTDVWSFGCVLYEMLTGRRPFTGGDISETIAAILKEEPDWGSLPDATPPLAVSLLRRCLRKDPKRRLHDIADARIEIEEALADLGAGRPLDASGGADARPSWRPSPGLLGVVALGLVVLGVLAGLAVASLLAPSLSRSATRIPMALPEGLAPSLGFGPTLAIAPDGQTLAYVLKSGTTTALYVKEPGMVEARRIASTEGARTPFFSPTGEWLGFFDEDDRKIKKVSLGGGEPAIIGDFDIQWGAAWTPDDTIVFTSYGGLVRVSADGRGAPQPVTVAGEAEHSWPTLLPGAEVALFTILPVRGSFEDATIAAVRLTGGPPKAVLEGAYYPRYSPTGHLIYVQGGRVLAAPFDPDTLTVTGPSAAVLDGVWTSSWTGYADFAFSDTGTLVYISGGPDPTRASVVSVDRNGVATPLLATRRPYRLPRLSPDGKQLMVVIGDEQVDIWSYDLERRTPNRVTLSPSWDAYPLWQPGAEWITFSSMREGLATTFRKHRLTEELERLIPADHPNYPSSWSSDGRLLAYWEENPDTGLDIWVYSAETRSRKQFLDTPFNESAPAFSPDGRFIAYHSNEAGRQLEVYVRPYPEVTPRHRISTEGGRTPRWGSEGRELFYIVDGKLMVVEIDAGDEFSAGPPRQLFAGAYGESYDVASDGSFFVMLQEWAAGDPPLRLVYTPNWFVDLDDRVASDR